MIVKKKATSKKPIKKKGSKKMVFEKNKAGDPQPVYEQPQTTPPAKGQPIKEPVDPLQGIEERQAAAQEPTQKVARGDVKPPVAKPTAFQEKKPEEMTGPEEEAMMVSGGVLPKEQSDKEKATVGPTGPVAMPAGGAPTTGAGKYTVGQTPMDPPPGASQK